MTSTSTGGWNNSSESGTEGEISPRKPLIALLLSICPGLGQQYAGRLVRGIVFYVSLVIISWLAAIAYMYVATPLVGILLLSVPFVGVAIIALDAALCARRAEDDYRLKWYNRFWIYVAVFLALSVTVNPLMDYVVGGRIVRALFVTSGSMYPTILKHDLVVINKLASPKRGDIVLIEFGKKDSDETASEKYESHVSRRITKVIEDQILRRVIGVEGDSVEINGRQIYLNGNPLEESYVSFGDTQSHNAFMDPDYRMESIVVPTNAYFVLADSRQFGFDSRVFGVVDQQEIGGVATKVFWSWNLDDGSFKWDRTAMSLK